MGRSNSPATYEGPLGSDGLRPGRRHASEMWKARLIIRIIKVSNRVVDFLRHSHRSYDRPLRVAQSSRRQSKALCARSVDGWRCSGCGRSSTIADWDNFLRLARSAICCRVSGERRMFYRFRISASHSKAVVGIERGLPDNITHLPAEGTCLKSDAAVGVINHHVELSGRCSRRLCRASRTAGRPGATHQRASPAQERRYPIPRKKSQSP
jgi:hypothetical protein